ncbi:MAG: TerD family protein [Sporichthyaceae bacterium]
MATLSKGGNAPLVMTSARTVLQWEGSSTPLDIDLCALLVGSSGKVGADEDFVFYNQPTHPTNAVFHEGRVGASDRMRVELTMLPSDVERVVLAASISDATFGDVHGLVLIVEDAATGAEEHRFGNMGASTETAFVVGELYLRNGAWKFRAIGQGWDSGLAGLVADYGVNVEGPADETPTGSSTPASTPTSVSQTPAVVTPPPIDSAPDVAPAPVAGTTPGISYTRPGKPTPPPEPTPAPEARGTPEATSRIDYARPMSTTARPAKPTAGTAQRRRVTAAAVPPRSDSLDAVPSTPATGESVQLTRGGAPATEHLWLRVISGNNGAGPATDVSALIYDREGTLRDLAFYGIPSAQSGAVTIVGQSISAAREDTTAVELRLNALDPAAAGIVIAATNYHGESLTPHRTILTEMVVADGTVLARIECPAPGSSAALLASLTRTDNGVWFMTALAIPTVGRSARSLVGAGHWALSA